jgi:hypothetical protein
MPEEDGTQQEAQIEDTIVFDDPIEETEYKAKEAETTEIEAEAPRKGIIGKLKNARDAVTAFTATSAIAACSSTPALPNPNAGNSRQATGPGGIDPDCVVYTDQLDIDSCMRAVGEPTVIDKIQVSPGEGSNVLNSLGDTVNDAVQGVQSALGISAAPTSSLTGAALVAAAAVTAAIRKKGGQVGESISNLATPILGTWGVAELTGVTFDMWPPNVFNLGVVLAANIFAIYAPFFKKTNRDNYIFAAIMAVAAFEGMNPAFYYPAAAATAGWAAFSDELSSGTASKIALGAGTLAALSGLS